MIVFNGDLIVAGDFETIGGYSIGYIAKWNGVAWQPMGAGFDWVVEDLEIYDSTLVAGGRFQSSGDQPVSHLAFWNGSNWSELARGTNGEVNSLAIYDEKLVVGGYFTEAGGLPANKIAAWDGSSWTTFGNGFAQGLYDSGAWVKALAVYQGQLYAAGELGPPFCGVARWNGFSWNSLNNGLRRSGCTGASSLLEYNGELIVGGFFWEADNGNDPSSWIPAYGIAKWDGSQWSALGTGLQGDFFQNVKSMCVYNGDLIVGGRFKIAGEVAADYVAVWNGTAWDNLGEGEGVENGIYDLHVFGGCLVAGGSFIWAGERSITERLAQWSGSEWSPFAGGGIHAVYGDIFTMADYQGKLLVCGNVPKIGNLFAPGNGLGLALWDGFTWSTLGNGIDGWIRTVVENEGKLFAAGEISDYLRGNIQSWDGSTWSDVGSGFDLDVYALAVYKGSVFATGDFRVSGSDSVNYIAAWDGSTWKPLGKGLDAPGRALAVFKDRLFVGGLFTKADGIPSRGVAVWNGKSWDDLGNPLDGTVLTFAEIDSELYVGGAFRHANDMIADGLAVYNPSGWRTFGSGVGGAIYTIAPFNGHVYLGGYFRRAGEFESFNFAKLESPLVPTFLVSFSATSSSNGVELHWKFTDDSLIASLKVERADYREGPWATMSDLDVRTNRDGQETLDRTVEPSRNYFYRLAVLTRTGEPKIFGPVRVETIKPTPHIGLSRLAPNPARGGVQVTFDVPEAMEVELSIIDVHGRQIASLIKGLVDHGSHEINWAGRTSEGTAPAGVYFVHLRLLGKTFTRRFLLLH